MSEVPQGVTAVFIDTDGHVIASANCFDRSRPSGFTVTEAQIHRVRDRLAVEVVKQLASPRLYENLSAYDCQQIVGKMKGKAHIVIVGGEDNGRGSL